jgi:hypothetical protein
MTSMDVGNSEVTPPKFADQTQKKANAPLS